MSALTACSVLCALQSYSGRVGQHYQRMEYSKVCLATLQFLARLSSDYLYLSKDRLYCEAGQGRPRLSGLSTILSITRAITGILSPVLPHLTEEAALACPALPSPFIQGWYEDSAWADPGMAAVSASLERVREELNKLESVKVSDISRMVGRYLGGAGWSSLCLLLDYDGTLAPHGSHPDLTVLPEAEWSTLIGPHP